MKFTPKILGKKDKSKKVKKGTKVASQDGQKKIIKKNVTKKPLNETPSNTNTDNKTNEINENVNNKSINVNTQNKNVPKIVNSSEKVSSISKSVENNKKDILAKSKTSSTELKNKKETKIGFEIEDDTISEVSDDFLKSSIIHDSIEDSATEVELHPKTNKKDHHKDNDDTLIEDTNSSDNKEFSSEIADETLIVEDSQRILETDEEEIKKISKKANEHNKKSQIENDNVEDLINEIKSKRINKNNNQQSKATENTESIYDLLEQEEFNQSIDTEVYNKPINSEDAEIQKIVKEKITPKRKVGRPPKKPRGRKPGKKQVEVIVISDAEGSDDDNDDENISLAQKKTLIKKELEKGSSSKVKQEDEENPVENSLKRTNFAIEIEEHEEPIRQAKRAKTTKKNTSNNNDDDEITEQENQKAKKAKAAKAKANKTTKASKASKSNKTLVEDEAEDNDSSDTNQKKKANKKRKASSPMKKTNKKKKVNEDGHHGSSDGEDSDNISISSRTIADIIDNYRGTEISTTQKEIYRLAALKRKATLDRKRGRLSTPEITTQTIPDKPKDDKTEKKPKVYDPEKK